MVEVETMEEAEDSMITMEVRQIHFLPVPDYYIIITIFLNPHISKIFYELK